MDPTGTSAADHYLPYIRNGFKVAGYLLKHALKGPKAQAQDATPRPNACLIAQRGAGACNLCLY